MSEENKPVIPSKIFDLGKTEMPKNRMDRLGLTSYAGDIKRLTKADALAKLEDMKEANGLARKEIIDGKITDLKMQIREHNSLRAVQILENIENQTDRKCRRFEQKADEEIRKLRSIENPTNITLNRIEMLESMQLAQYKEMELIVNKFMREFFPEG